MQNQEHERNLGNFIMSSSFSDETIPAATLPTTTEEDEDDDDDENSTTSLYPAPTSEYHQVARDALLFSESLRDFHSSFGTPFSVPTVGGKALDLHHLFVEVTARGGLQKVIKDRKWREVVMTFNFPSTITNGSFALRKHYMSQLYHFEQVYYFRKQVPPTPFPASEAPILKLGCPINGTIDGKFDNGYIVTMNFDSDILMGVLYHIPYVGRTSHSTNTSIVPRPRNQNRSRMAVRDHSLNKLNMGHNFFSEQYT